MAEAAVSAIRLEGVAKTYRSGALDVPALKALDLDLAYGEFLGIMGASGSGKSTLLNILGLLDVPSAGRYILDGKRVESMPDAELARLRNKKIGFIFQAFNLFPHLTVEENIEAPMVYGELPRKTRRERAKELAAKVGLAHRLDHRPTQLSGGECQRVAVARSLANKPTFLLADEPTGNLDEKTGKGIMELFNELHAEGVTIVMVTHNPSYEEAFDKVVVLKDGALLRLGVKAARGA
jgi:putative ABC transport system ATP-binding protein